MHKTAYEISAPALRAHVSRPSTMALVGLGVAAAIAHATLRFPVRLPGHHGLEWMALLVIARQLSAYGGAATVAAAGAAMASFVLMHDPMAPLAYLVPGIALDAIYGILSAERRRSVAWLALAAGLAHGVKPLVQWTGAAILALPFGASERGLAFVVAMHVAFGLAGGALGALLGRLWPR